MLGLIHLPIQVKITICDCRLSNIYSAYFKICMFYILFSLSKNYNRLNDFSILPLIFTCDNIYYESTSVIHKGPKWATLGCLGYCKAGVCSINRTSVIHRGRKWATLGCLGYCKAGVCSINRTSVIQTYYNWFLRVIMWSYIESLTSLWQIEKTS